MSESTNARDKGVMSVTLSEPLNLPLIVDK
jgi:hypothetical protein